MWPAGGQGMFQLKLFKHPEQTESPQTCHTYICPNVKATTESCCSLDGTFITSHKTKRAAIAPGEVIWLDMATHTAPVLEL